MRGHLLNCLFSLILSLPKTYSLSHILVYSTSYIPVPQGPLLPYLNSGPLCLSLTLTLSPVPFSVPRDPDPWPIPDPSQRCLTFMPVPDT